MVRIRLTRVGRRNKAYWRVAAFDSRTRRDGKPLEYLGYYDPHQDDIEQKLRVDRDRVAHWLSKGAQPSETVASIIKKLKIQ